MFHIVSSQRGGGPLHFWLEHFLLRWWPGLPALRAPSIAFGCVGIAGAALVARTLIGEEGAAGVAILFALSPIPVLYATFGRPHTMLFAWLMWGTLVALHAARTGSRAWWIAAGAVLGLSVLVHPTAPLYVLTAFAAAVVYAPRSWRVLVREVWPGVVALLVTFVPYYVKTLHVLGDRYGVGGPTRGRTFSGRPVWEDALHFVAPGGHDLNYFTVTAAAGVAVLAARRRWRPLAFCAITVAMPVLFFTFVPASGDSALFFDRYMIPVTPAFLVLVLVALLEIARWSGGLRVLTLAVLVAGLAAVEAHYDLSHLRQQRGIHLDAITHAVAAGDRGAVLFGTTGTSGAIFSSFDYGHPANILDHYLALRVPGLEVVDDDACLRALPFLRRGGPPRHGLWVFYAASPPEVVAAGDRFAAEHDVTFREVAGAYFVVRSKRALPPRALIALGRRVRLRWREAVPLNRRVDELLQADRQLLRVPPRCTPYGQLGDPDIDPHWPPLATAHQ
ncbi:MAG TPA: glycosyltransferase family 39 protein [Gaiellaceae bacterium]|nr:glycosyltransferase family 39 protein [Gaiellaceae bacterium]